jgi:predicted metal-dependent hydrolase
MPHREPRLMLFDKVHSWSRRLKVKPQRIRVQQMTRKWGSCSTAGTITLAADLIDQDEAFQDFVIAHELLHLRVPNHSKLFTALMNAHLPGWRNHSVRKLRTAS